MSDSIAYRHTVSVQILGTRRVWRPDGSLVSDGMDYQTAEDFVAECNLLFSKPCSCRSDVRTSNLIEDASSAASNRVIIAMLERRLYDQSSLIVVLRAENERLRARLNRRIYRLCRFFGL